MNIGRLCIRDVVTALRDEPIGAVADRMLEHHVGSVVVVDQEGSAPRPIGVVTDRDLVRALGSGELARARTLDVGDVMSRDLLLATEDEEVFEVLDRMRVRGVRRVPVLGAGGILVGVLSIDDVLGWLASQVTSLDRLVRHELRNEAARDLR